MHVITVTIGMCMDMLMCVSMCTFVYIRVFVGAFEQAHLCLSQTREHIRTGVSLWRSKVHRVSGKELRHAPGICWALSNSYKEGTMVQAPFENSK